MDNWESERERIIGLGDNSMRKSYYPMLQARLRELERFRSMLDGSLDGILVVCVDKCKVIDANNTASELFETERDELVGLKFEVLFEASDFEKIKQWIDDDSQDSLVAYRIKRELGGLPAHFEINITRSSEAGSVLVCVVRDISRRVAAEEGLKAAKEEAEKASLVKSEFLAVMSHEMRTPLNPILGFAQLLRDSIQSEPEAEYLELIIQAANRQLELIDDILSYTGMDQGKMEASWSEFSLYELCQSALRDVSTVSHGLSLKLNYGSPEQYLDKDLIVEGELSMLQRILDNLLGNACKYTKEGEITLSVNSGSVDGEFTSFHFAIEDTGIGISSGVVADLFDAFTQADSSHKRRYEGVGLGLAICKKLVDYLGGEIAVTSVVGEGSKFSFWVPMRIREKNGTSEVSNSDGLQTLKYPCSILIFEDKQDNADFLKAVLKKMGAEAEHASDAHRGVELCLKRKFDCILMDLSMPDMSGFEACETIRKCSYENKHTPILAVTANVSEGIREKCLSVGFDGYLDKPVDANRLCAAINTYLKPPQL